MQGLGIVGVAGVGEALTWDPAPRAPPLSWEESSFQSNQKPPPAPGCCPHRPVWLRGAAGGLWGPDLLREAVTTNLPCTCKNTHPGAMGRTVHPALSLGSLSSG